MMPARDVSAPIAMMPFDSVLARLGVSVRASPAAERKSAPGEREDRRNDHGLCVGGLDVADGKRSASEKRARSQQQQTGLAHAETKQQVVGLVPRARAEQIAHGRIEQIDQAAVVTL